MAFYQPAKERASCPSKTGSWPLMPPFQVRNWPIGFALSSRKMSCQVRLASSKARSMQTIWPTTASPRTSAEPWKYWIAWRGSIRPMPQPSSCQAYGLPVRSRPSMSRSWIWKVWKSWTGLLLKKSSLSASSYLNWVKKASLPAQLSALPPMNSCSACS